jgi:hypothetical protein
MIVHEKGNITCLSFPLFDRFPELVNVISTRKGGVSEGMFRSMNVSFHVDDCEGRVVKNRELLCSVLDLDPFSLTAARQVHGTNITIVEERHRGRGSVTGDDSIPDSDGLITNLPGITLMIHVADCAAISFYDPVQHVIGLVHGSWRGTGRGIAGIAIRKMNDMFGSKPEHIFAGIGPAIGPCCYEISDDVIDAFEQAFPSDAAKWIVRNPSGKKHLDLWQANRKQILDAGIREENIEVAELCTSCCTDLFYSHRAEGGKTGRFCGLIHLKRQ